MKSCYALSIEKSSLREAPIAKFNAKFIPVTACPAVTIAPKVSTTYCAPLSVGICLRIFIFSSKYFLFYSFDSRLRGKKSYDRNRFPLLNIIYKYSGKPSSREM